MAQRNLQSKIESIALERKKMAFVSGPRQCGKTTLAKAMLRNSKFHCSWDQLKFRQIWIKNPEELARLALEEAKPRIALDEIHKNKKWKTELKGFYDEFGDKIEIIVTGSARLNVYRKGGDSLLGRFYHFSLHPFSLSEYLQKEPLSFEKFSNFVAAANPQKKRVNFSSKVDNLLKFGGFPEPLLSEREDVHQLWQKNRLELLVRQDLRDMTRITELSQVEILASLLPLRVGSPLSIQSLREDVEVAFTTIQRWLKFLEALYYYYPVKPYSRSVARSLKKEAKIYLYDWSSVESTGARFENMVASHLLKMCDYWSDLGIAQLQLGYLRNKEKNEVDFVVIKNKDPWFTLEAKSASLQLDPTYQVFQKQLGVPHFQVIKESGVFRGFKTPTGPAHVVSFDQFFYGTP